MKRYLNAAALAIALILFGWLPVNAADASGVVIPWGEWARDLLVASGSILIAVLTWAVSKLPAFVRVFLTNDVISKAVNYGIGAVEGAVAGKTLTLESTSAVITAAEQYAVATAPTISKWIGDNLRPLILAKLTAAGVVPPDVSADAVGAAVATK